MQKFYSISFAAFLLFSFSNCAPKKIYNNRESISQNYIIDSTIVKDPSVNLLITQYKKGLDSMMSKVVARTDKPMTKAQPDCTLGYWVADALLAEAKKKDPLVHAAISNQGGIRINYVAPGDITLGQVYEISPFENTLYILEVPADTLEKWCQHIAEKGGWPVSNITFTIKDGKASNIYVDNKPLNRSLVYKIATNDYLANGGDDCAFLKDCKTTKYNVLLRDAMIHYATELKTLNFQLENRISYGE